jgi:hypothetical protein
LQAGGRRFDPVWLHQAALQIKAENQKLVRENYQSATAGFLSGAGVMSDIVKRRSIRAFGAAVKGREGRAISNQGSKVRNP